MWVTDGAATHEAVWWNAGDKTLPVGKFDLAFTPQINQFNGTRCVQLKVLDWRRRHIAMLISPSGTTGDDEIGQKKTELVNASTYSFNRPFGT